MTPLNLPPAEPRRPGWLELIVGLLTYVVTMGVMLIWLVQIPETQAGLRGIVGNAANGIAGVAGLLAAFFLRIRDLRSFGFRPVSPKWLVMALGLAAMAFGLSFVIEHVYFSFIEEANTQADMQTAAKAGFLSLAILVFTGGLLTPFAEEFVFRGVVANALNKYGWFAGVVISAAIFGIVHGLSVIFILAFMVGLITGALFRKTGSIYPCLVVHVAYNSAHLISYSFL